MHYTFNGFQNVHAYITYITHEHIVKYTLICSCLARIHHSICLRLSFILFYICYCCRCSDGNAIHVNSFLVLYTMACVSFFNAYEMRPGRCILTHPQNRERRRSRGTVPFCFPVRSCQIFLCRSQFIIMTFILSFSGWADAFHNINNNNNIINNEFKEAKTEQTINNDDRFFCEKWRMRMKMCWSASVWIVSVRTLNLFLHLETRIWNIATLGFTARTNV